MRTRLKEVVEVMVVGMRGEDARRARRARPNQEEQGSDRKKKQRTKAWVQTYNDRPVRSGGCVSHDMRERVTVCAEIETRVVLSGRESKWAASTSGESLTHRGR